MDDFNYVLLTCILYNLATGGIRRNRYFPPGYELPIHEWPREVNAPVLEGLPKIDASVLLNNDYDYLGGVNEIMYACENFGMFQIKNAKAFERYSVMERDMVIENAMRSSTRFFDLPPEQLYEFSAPIPAQRLLYSSTYQNLTGKEPCHHYWRDVLSIGLDSVVPAQDWPTKPNNFKADLWQFGVRAKLVEARLLKLISQGLRLNLGEEHFVINNLNNSSFINVTRFPACPDPTKAIGMPRHGDPSLITIAYAGEVPGLQLFYNGRWWSVEPDKDALVVMVGHALAVVSNDRFKAARHRIVVNRERDQLGISYHTSPDLKCKVKPAPELIENTPPVYKEFLYKDFLDKLVENGRNTDAALPGIMY